jgi:ERCC4-related helicase
VAGAATIPEAGKLIQLRGRPAIIQAVSPHVGGDQQRRHLVHLEYVDEHQYPSSDTVLWEAEPEIRVRQTQGWPDIRYTAPDAPGHYQAYSDAIRWTSLQTLEGFLLDSKDIPLVSPWSAAVQVEDYQLVPLLRALSMPRVSLLLADDVGLGKTIQAGLIATELMMRRGIRRILIVCPASLQYQWKQEMQEKFHLDFTVMDGAQVRRIQLEHGSDVNPWSVHNRIITSMDFLKQDLVHEQFETSAQRIRGELGGGRHPWDLLIVDEAHNLAPRRLGGDSMRTRMMRSLTFHFEHRLFLTATPHNGFVESFTGLLELLDPYRFIQRQELTDQDKVHRDAVMVRRLKRHINEASSTPRFPERELHGVEVMYSPQEKAVWQALRAYRDSAYKHLDKDGSRKRNLGQFLFSLLSKRLLSSPYAFARTWWAHVAGDDQASEEEADKARRRAEEETGDDIEQADRERTAATQAGTWIFQQAPTLRDPAERVSEALRKLGWDEATTRAGAAAGVDIADGKWGAILEHIRKGAKVHDAPALGPLVGPASKPSESRLLLFTEYRDTQELILARLAEAGYRDNAVKTLYGGMSASDRDEVKELFNHPDSKLRILVATDAASEGLNLQKRCHTVAHYDIPWNPMRLEQRNGRVDRHGQPSETVWVFHYNSSEEEDDAFLRRLIGKVHQAREDLGSVEAVIAVEVHNRLVLGRREKSLLAWDDSSIDTGIEALEQTPPPLQDYHQAQHQFDAASKAYGLDEEAIRNLVSCFLSRQHQATLVQGRNGLEIRGAKGRIKKLLTRHLADGSGNLPSLVFDPDDYMVPLGKRRVYQPRYGTQLMRIGHPVTQAALQHYRRLLWNPMDSALSRWTMHAIPGNEAYVVFQYLVTIRNQLQEIIHSRLDSRAFHVTKSGLQADPDFQSGNGVGPAGRPVQEAWQERLGQAVAASASVLQGLLAEVSAREHAAWSARLDEARATAKDEYVKGFNQQIREMQARGIESHKQILERSLAAARERAKQTTLNPALNEMLLARVRELQDQLKPENLRVWAANNETQIDRLTQERDRFMKHVLPKRYALKEGNPGQVIEVIEVGIKAYVPEVA